MTKASTPQVRASGTPMMSSAITSMTATAKPKIVVTIQYLRTRAAKFSRPSAICGRVSRITSIRSFMPAASKARNRATARIRISSEAPLVMALSRAWAGSARLLSWNDEPSALICSWP